MTVYHIEFAKTGLNTSGGEKSMLETIKYLADKKIKNVILTTDNGQKVYEDSGVSSSIYIEYQTIESFKTEKKYHIFISYLMRIKKIKKLYKTLNIDLNSAMICHSAFFPNSIGAWMLHKKNNFKASIYWHHLIPPRLFRGYKGEYSSRFTFPSLSLIHFHLNQKLYYNLHPKDAIMVTHNIVYKNALLKKSNARRIKIIKGYGGLDGNIKFKTNKKKKYDIAWMGRFQDLKGLDDFLKACFILKNRNPNIRILIIGGGNKIEVDKFKLTVKNLGLTENIKYEGFILGNDRYSRISEAKVFAATSYFESYGLVNIEVLKLGVPLVTYDLPSYRHLPNTVKKVEIGNVDSLADNLESLLNNRELEFIATESKRLSDKFSWTITNSQIKKLIDFEKEK